MNQLPCHRPGGIRQQFKAASPMVEGLLQGLKKEDRLQGPLSSKVLDQGDAVGAWFGKDQGGPLAAVLFATSETLKQVSFLLKCWTRGMLWAPGLAKTKAARWQLFLSPHLRL